MPFRRTSLRLLTVGVLLCALCFATAVFAQQQPSPDAPSASRKTPSVPIFSTLARKSFVFPDIATTEGPLSSGGKFKLFVSSSISLSTLFASAAGAGISQADDSPEGYGQGGDGYAKRFGSSMARHASNNFFGTFLLASALHEDPRFFPQTNPTFGGSVKYSVQRLFLTRRDSGGDTVNWSGLLGPALGEGLANAYWPEHERTAGDTLQRYGTDLAVTAGYNMLRNYWPVFFKRLRGGSAGERNR